MDPALQTPRSADHFELGTRSARNLVQVLPAHAFDRMIAPLTERVRPFILATTDGDRVHLKGEDARLAASDLLRLVLRSRACPVKAWLEAGCTPQLHASLVHWQALQAAPRADAQEPGLAWVLGMNLENLLGSRALGEALMRGEPSALRLIAEQCPIRGPSPQPKVVPLEGWREELLAAMPMLEESWLRPYASHVLTNTDHEVLRICRAALAQRMPNTSSRLDADTSHRLAQLELLELLCAAEHLAAGPLLEDALPQWLALRQAAEIQRGPIDAASAASLRLLPCALGVIRSWLQRAEPHLDYGYSRLSGPAALEATRENLIQLGLLAVDVRAAAQGDGLAPGFDIELSEALLEVEQRLGAVAHGATMHWLAAQNEVAHA